MYWPPTIFTWVGIFAAFSLGSFVAMRFSRLANHHDAIAVVSLLLALVWVTRLLSGVENLSGLAAYTVVALIGGFVGAKFARRRQIAESS